MLSLHAAAIHLGHQESPFILLIGLRQDRCRLSLGFHETRAMLALSSAFGNASLLSVLVTRMTHHETRLAKKVFFTSKISGGTDAVALQIARVVIVRVIVDGVLGVTVDVHIGHDEVHVIYVAIFVVIFCNWRCTLYTTRR